MNDIILRPWQREDAQALAAIANNKNVWLNVRDAFPNPYTVMDALQWINVEGNRKPTIHFAIVYQGKVAGSAGLLLKEDVYRKSIEIGYFIGEIYWNKGIATTAVQSITSYAIQQFDVNRIYAEVFEHNKASMKVLEKNGFYLESTRKNAVIKNGVVMNDCVWVKLV
jgi:RimJ/RimL family protein N-acetyltransferase